MMRSRTTSAGGRSSRQVSAGAGSRIGTPAQAAAHVGQLAIVGRTDQRLDSLGNETQRRDAWRRLVAIEELDQGVRDLDRPALPVQEAQALGDIAGDLVAAQGVADDGLAPADRGELRQVAQRVEQQRAVLVVEFAPHGIPSLISCPPTTALHSATLSRQSLFKLFTREVSANCCQTVFAAETERPVLVMSRNQPTS